MIFKFYLDNYSEQFVNGFVEGDKLARALERQKQQQPPPPKPIPVNLNSLKTEEGVPSPQIEVELGEEEDVEVPLNVLEDEEEDDDMDWEWEEDEDPLEYDEDDQVEIGETKCTRSTGEIKEVTVTSAGKEKAKRVKRPNIIVDGKYKCRYCEEDTCKEFNL